MEAKPKIKRHEYSETQKQFLLNILLKVKHLDYKFYSDVLSFPTDKQVEDMNAGKYQHRLRINIQHYGRNTDKPEDPNCSWLTYCGNVFITEWSEKAITEAIFITLIQKLRHEASELFSYDGIMVFHEHRTELVAIPK